MKNQISPKLKFLFIKKVNRWARDWQKVFRKHLSHKGLFLRIVMNFFYKSTTKRHVIIKNGQKTPTCSREIHMNVQLAGEKVLSIICTTQMYKLKCKIVMQIAMQIETAARFHLIPSWMAKIQKTDNTKCWQRWAELNRTWCW